MDIITFINSLTNEDLNRIRNSKSDAEARRLLREHQALQLQQTGVNRCFSIGEKVIIEKCIHGHSFSIGSEVEIIDCDNNFTANWLCIKENEKWWISEDEARLK